MLAMSALSMQALSGGRFILGIGTSGPQVMEGWHGVRFDRPVRRTRETIDVIRMICAGERLAYAGEVYTLPLPDGEGRSIRSLLPPAHVPVYVAALGPANLRLTGELADGWIGNSFFPENADVFLDPIREGAVRAGRDAAELDLTVSVSVELTDDVDAAARRPDDLVRERLRLYRDAGITELRAQFGGGDPDRHLDDLGHLLDLVADVNAEVPA
jgi:alkanesulfonate monooxygenase SsuD/methylene tetrahydromethanopterin reductase-like flavin-dependent oxidoreductase (luciferase family)